MSRRRMRETTLEAEGPAATFQGMYSESGSTSINREETRGIHDSDSVVETRALRWAGLLPLMACPKVGDRALDRRQGESSRKLGFLSMNPSTSAIPRPELD